MSKKKSTALVVYDSEKHRLVANDDMIKDRNHSISEQIEAAKKSMNPALLKEADILRQGIDQMFTRGFQKSWKMGERLKKIETDVDTFEAGAIPKIAAYIHYSKEALYKWMRFYEDYTEEEVGQLAAMRLKLAGSPLSWRHIDEANFVEDKKLRFQFLQLAAKHDLTPEEMGDAIRQQFGASSGRGTARHAGGRPVKIPSTYTARMENLEKFCGQILRNSKDMWQHKNFGFLQTIDEVPADKLPDLVSKMDKDLTQIEAASEKLQEIHKEMQKARAIAADRIDEQARATGSDEGKAAGKKSGKGKKSPKASVEADEDKPKTLAEELQAVGDD